jgi:hypothetical protein
MGIPSKMPLNFIKKVWILLFFHFFIHILEFGPGFFKARPVLFFPTARPHGNDSADDSTLTSSGQGKMLRADSYPYSAAESGAAKSKLRVCFLSDDRTDRPSWIGLSFVVGICIRRRRRFGILRSDTQKKLSCTTRCKKVVFVLHHRQEEVCCFYSRAVN